MDVVIIPCVGDVVRGVVVKYDKGCVDGGDDVVGDIGWICDVGAEG